MTHDTTETGRDEALWWFLRIIEATGGKADASDYHGNPINAFCEDRPGDLDTYNLADQRGLTTSSHDTSFDTSTVYLTDAGREYIARFGPPPQKEPDQ